MARRGSVSILICAVLMVAAGACDRMRNEATEEDVAVDEKDMIARDAPEPLPAPVVRTGDPATDDVAYLHRQGLITGHMIAFLQLYRIGDYAAANSHLIRPDNELYSALAPAMAARGDAGFAGALAQLAATADAHGDVEAQYQTLMEEIDANGPVVGVKDMMLVVSEVVRSASAAFGRGVGASGAVTDATEYQYGYGLMVAARNLLSKVSTHDINETEAIAVAHEQLDAVEASFPALTAQETDGDAVSMQSAADVIERAALRLG